ncbi:MAG: FMN-binding protein [Butyricicoccus sp.]
MEKVFVALFAAALVILNTAAWAEESTGLEGFAEWYISSESWMTVENGHWSSDQKDQPTDEEIEKMLRCAVLPQTAGGQTTTFFVVIKDVDEQRKIIGDKYCPVEQTSTEGTVTILVMADNILTDEEGRSDAAFRPLKPKNRNQAYFDAGTACGALMTAAQSMGYYTHLWGSNVGPNAPFDLAEGQYQSMCLYMKDEYTGMYGYHADYGKEDQIVPEYTMPVRGNYVLVCSVVIGKPIKEERADVTSFATCHGRPQRWAFWDGEYNEAPLSNASYAVPVEQVETVIELAENEYLGEAKGMHSTIKVKIAVEDGKMTAVEVVEQNDTAGVVDKALVNVPAAILEAQSVEVDNVSGATVTSEAIKAAATDAMAQAGI